jgi:hypothetical protein
MNANFIKPSIYKENDSASTPSSGYVFVYPKTDRKLYYKNSDGNEIDLSLGLSSFNTIQSNSASWNYQATDVKILTANWQNTYSLFRSQSANNLSVFSNVNSNSSFWSSAYNIVVSNSASWNYQATDVKILTANWQNTYSTVNANSAGWSQTLVFNESNAQLTITPFGNTISLSALSGHGASTGASYLSALNDVSIPSPVNGQVLTYNSILNKWTAGTPISATGATGYYGSFYDERNQNATSPTIAYTIAMSGTFESNGISLSSNSIIFQYAGTYEIIYSLQIENSHNAQEDVQVWFTKNGVDIPNSNSVFTVHAKTGNKTGKIVMVTPFITTVNNGDAIGIKWAAADTGVSIVSLPPNITPTTPAAPGVIFTVKQVTNVQSISANWQQTINSYSMFVLNCFWG